MLNCHAKTTPSSTTRVGPRVLRGAAIISGAPKIAEMAGRLGWDTF
jgi:hypothetical protein